MSRMTEVARELNETVERDQLRRTVEAMHEWLNREHRGGATVVRIEAVRAMLPVVKR